MNKQFSDIIYDVSSLCHKVVMFLLIFLSKSSDIAGVQSFQVFAKPFSIIASEMSTVVKASVNLIEINYWFINSHHYSLQWLFSILLKIKMHKADKGSCSFDNSFYSFKGVKTQILFTCIQLFSLRPVREITHPLLFLCYFAIESCHLPSSSIR